MLNLFPRISILYCLIFVKFDLVFSFIFAIFLSFVRSFCWQIFCYICGFCQQFIRQSVALFGCCSGFLMKFSMFKPQIHLSKTFGRQIRSQIFNQNFAKLFSFLVTCDSQLGWSFKGFFLHSNSSPIYRFFCFLEFPFVGRHFEGVGTQSPETPTKMMI